MNWYDEPISVLGVLKCIGIGVVGGIGIVFLAIVFPEWVEHVALWRWRRRR